ncbi:hypothetical protein B0T14DRAFT_255626 [Immersiella caudata]|uniref:F-box domain-containing protein n=1 Tax=Immersiella caudata TaxID=314043 RepID=A0AA39WKC2_9PEZI|nr:hypothetical protein B0T14DRAFT_255626 [Immersiella caudata]
MERYELHGCVICGQLFTHARDGIGIGIVYPRSSYYRAIYQLRVGYGIALSGESLLRDSYIDTGRFWAPDDSTHDQYSTDANGFPVVRVEVPVGRLPTDDDSPDVADHPDGPVIPNYLVHGACWKVLEHIYAPDPVPYKRLWEVCRSLTRFDRRVPYWGHDYGGLPTYLPPGEKYPWHNKRRRDFTGLGNVPEHDPMNRDIETEMTAIWFAFSNRKAQPPPPSKAPPQPPSAVTSDCFSRLPSEIRLEIVLLLNGSDLLSLRLASRSFWFAFHEKSFWMSHFLFLGGERECLFKSMAMSEDRVHADRDWRSLYWRTDDSWLSPGLRYRGRILLLGRSMQQVLGLRFPREPGAYDMTSCAGRTITWLEDESVQEKLESINWDLQPQAEMLWKSHFCFHSLYVYVPDPIATLSFSFATLGDRRYLAGMTINTATTGQRFRFGYVDPSNSPPSVDVEGLYGFVLALDPMGISAIQCIDQNGVVGSWIGIPGPSPTVTQLAGDEQVWALKANFDVIPSPKRGNHQEGRELR